jgi:hypothetical protein
MGETIVRVWSKPYTVTTDRISSQFGGLRANTRASQIAYRTALRAQPSNDGASGPVITGMDKQKETAQPRGRGGTWGRYAAWGNWGVGERRIQKRRSLPFVPGKRAASAPLGHALRPP